jgi:uncharacterized membrane protein
MPIGLQEMHPAVVHFPIAFLPLSLGADALGRLTGDYVLMDMGRRLMPLAAASAVNAAAFGLVAQQAVRAEGQAHDLLVTHRTLNAGLVALTTALAAARVRRRRPGLGYLAVGLAAAGVMGYSAYLGGRMSYEHGVGVKAAGGLNEARGPEVRPGNLGESARTIARNLRDGVRGAVAESASGELVPAFTSPGKAFDDPERHLSAPRDT